METRKIQSQYREKENEIKERIREFRGLEQASEKRIFQELVFVILTSQTEAEKAWDAAKDLKNDGLLIEGSREEIMDVLEREGISYSEDKANYIVENRSFLMQPTLDKPEKGLKLKRQVWGKEPEKSREWLVENIKGLSWKGASHFLRNVGRGKDFAIISGHIIRKMHQLGLLKEPDFPGGREEYIEYEEKLREFSEKIDIPLEELDLVLWSMETGEVFK
ncbi:MAG: hypothetical protein BRC26_03645 [Nanohaloarchaea archaeon QH_8_44_6]|nr:MAG: hypothetical protein BRC26_03645 [Nanohaloarchaea archaeon QH_8_44_6]